MVQNELQKITDLKFEIISQDEMTLNIHYPQLLEQSEYGGSYVKPVLKIEAGVRSARVPTIKKQIDSFFEQVLEKLYHSKYGQMAINDLELLADVVRHKSTFYKDNKADYENATPPNIKIVPTVELNDSFKTDYEDMAKSMIVGNAPSYKELIEILSIIEIKLKD